MKTLVLILTTVQFSTISFAAEMFTGQIKAEGLDKRGQITYAKEFPFAVKRNNSDWTIEIDFGGYKEMTGSDGVKTCTLLRDQSGLQQGLVTPGAYPAQSEPTTRLIWLALASEQYLSTNANLPALWSNPFYTPGAQGVVAKTTSSNGIPMRMEFYLSSKQLKSEEARQFRSSRFSQAEIDRVAEAIKPVEGIKAGEYWITAVGATGERKYPRSFIVEFSPPTPVGATYVSQRLSADVKEVKLVAVDSFLPTLTTNQYVRDYRLSDRERQIDYVGYVITNGSWTTGTELWLKTLFAQKKAEHASTER